MDLLLSVLALLLMAAGFVGCIVPALPGPAIAFAGLLCCYGCHTAPFDAMQLILWGVAMMAVTVVDYFLPAFVTRWFGCSHTSSVGATIGLLVGVLFTPVGMLAGSFLGAMIGELLHDSRRFGRALLAGIGAFLAFVFGTGIKLAVTAGMAFLIIQGCWYTVAALFQ